jgi:ribonuclease G
VWLKSGGSIVVINQTEALVAIDVNTGRYVEEIIGQARGHHRQDEPRGGEGNRAAGPPARSRRIIVLDFIDMEEKKNRQKVLQAVEQELKKDRSPSKALQVSDFGLVIITRKRVKQSLERVMTEPCPCCSGTGTIKSTSTICYEILNEVKKIGSDLNGHRLLLRVNRTSRGAERRRKRRLARSAVVAWQGRHRQVRPATASRAIRRHGV